MRNSGVCKGRDRRTGTKIFQDGLMIWYAVAIVEEVEAGKATITVILL